MKQFVTRMFGESIKERMNELGMTKTDLIKNDGESTDFWETDYYNPKLDRK